MLSTFLRQEIY